MSSFSSPRTRAARRIRPRNGAFPVGRMFSLLDTGPRFRGKKPTVSVCAAVPVSKRRTPEKPSDAVRRGSGRPKPPIFPKQAYFYQESVSLDTVWNVFARRCLGVPAGENRAKTGEIRILLYIGARRKVRLAFRCSLYYI